MNSVSIIGNLTRDPELRHMPSGTEVCGFAIAVNEKRGDEEYASFIEVECFGKTAETSAQYLAKGRKVGIEGRLRQDRWDAQDGTKRERVKIIANRVDFLSPRDENNATAEAGAYTAPAGSADDDIPF